LEKLSERDEELYVRLRMVKGIQQHPVFYITEGSIEEWGKSNSS
jgi:hypothetical protein